MAQEHAEEGIMRFLLTSTGITNTSIHHALVELLGKPIAESSARCIPTATYALPGGAALAWRFTSRREPICPMCELGWKSLGLLGVTALPSIDEARWVPLVQETDVLMVNGGAPLDLCSWMRQSGLADRLPSLRAVYVGLSAGSMVLAPTIWEDFVRWTPPSGGDETLGMVGFALFPHLDHEDLPDHSLADAERWAAGMSVPASAFDDQTAVKVIDGTVAVVSEGHWQRFAPEDRAAQRVARDVWLRWPKLGGLETLPKSSDAEMATSRPSFPSPEEIPSWCRWWCP
jgi:dipeptidase E